MKDLTANIQCPNCHRSMQVKVKEMVPGRHKNCPYCRTVITFSGDDGRKMQRELDKFQRTLKKLGR